MVVMLKYDFCIRTREGQKVESIVIAGRDRADAERKLVQMYRHCTILRCEVRGGGGRQDQLAAGAAADALSLSAK